MKPSIRFLVRVMNTGPDTSGNTRHHGRITSTISGRTLYVQECDTENSLGIKVRRALAAAEPEPRDFDAVIESHVHMGLRAWKQAIPTAGYWEQQVTAAMIMELEVVKELQL